MMGKFLCFFCAFLAVSWARIILVEDNQNLELLGQESFAVEPHIFENKILEAILKFKEFLQKGDPGHNIPPLDPYFLKHQDFNFFVLDTTLHGFLKNTTFSDFSMFKPETIEFKLIPLHFKLKLSLDQLKINGRYKMSGKILGEMLVNGTGTFTSETKNASLTFYLRPTKVDSVLQIKDLIFELTAFSEKITYTNELIDNKVHELDEDLALHILDQIQTKYFPPLLNMVKVVVNHFLLGYSFADVMKIILEFLNKK